MTKDPASSAKWARSAKTTHLPSDKPDPLFYLKDGRPLPVVGEMDPVFAAHGFLRDRFEPRGVAQSFRPEPASNLLLRLRAFLGVNARCEILSYLLLNRRGSPRSIARDCGYYSATISKALAEMGESNYVIFRVEGRHRYYTLIPDTWRKLLMGDASPTWLIWPRLFSALEQIWLFLWRADLEHLSPLAQASALRRILLDKTVEKINGSGLDFTFGDVSAYPGEAIIPFFTDRMTALFDALGLAAQPHHLAGRGDGRLTTDQIMALTRGEA
jgi:DNA-binding transcriptional ArsR family regulator